MTKPHPPHARVCAWLVALLVLAAGSLGFASDARADSTVQTVVCWKRLLNDWYDGRIDRAYPVRCYREAIANLPEDVKVYADAEADIRRALLAAIRQSTKDSPGTKVTEATPVKPPVKPKPPAAKPKAKPTPTTTEDENEETAAGPVDPDPNDPLAGAETLPTGATRSADSLPLPLLVLGALALLLLTAAGAGVVNKRLQARRIAAAPPPTEEPPPVV